LLQDDIAKFDSKPASPPRLVNIPEEGKGKAKEHREVGEGDDTVTIEDTSDEEDGDVTPQFFLITVINANDRIGRVKPVKPRSNLGQHGSSPENLVNEP
jgi:hypothetical protein